MIDVFTEQFIHPEKAGVATAIAFFLTGVPIRLPPVSFQDNFIVSPIRRKNAIFKIVAEQTCGSTGSISWNASDGRQK